MGGWGELERGLGDGEMGRWGEGEMGRGGDGGMGRGYRFMIIPNPAASFDLFG